MSSHATKKKKKKQMDHLVGRQLVPFFMPDTEEENTNQHLVPLDPTRPEEEFVVRARTFKDGYFVEPEFLEAEDEVTPRPTKSSASSPDKRRRRSKKSKAPVSNDTHYAEASFAQAPEPTELPLPSFGSHTNVHVHADLDVVPSRDTPSARASPSSAMSPGQAILMAVKHKPTTSSSSSTSTSSSSAFSLHTATSRKMPSSSAEDATAQLRALLALGSRRPPMAAPTAAAPSSASSSSSSAVSSSPSLTSPKSFVSVAKPPASVPSATPKLFFLHANSPNAPPTLRTINLASGTKSNKQVALPAESLLQKPVAFAAAANKSARGLYFKR